MQTCSLVELITLLTKMTQFPSSVKLQLSHTMDGEMFVNSEVQIKMTEKQTLEFLSMVATHPSQPPNQKKELPNDQS